MKDYLRRHIWILSKLYENPKGLTYKEFAYEWGRTELNSLKTPLPKRTFADCLRAIEEAFDIQISSDARNGYRYRIVNREWLEKDNVKDWLLSAFAVNGLLQDSKGLRDRVMYEEIPSGNEYLLKILGAMKKDNVIRISYQDFYDTNIPDWEEASEMTNQGNIRRYALDRIKYLEVTDETFKMPVHFSAESYFANAFGIIVEPEKYKVERIRLKVTDINHRRQYIRSLPLHDSQREVERYDDYSIFELQVMPAYDFIQQILAMSNEVEVLSPENVREEIARWVKEIAKLYC